jgi:hypothetical protein
MIGSLCKGTVQKRCWFLLLFQPFSRQSLRWAWRCMTGCVTAITSVIVWNDDSKDSERIDTSHGKKHSLHSCCGCLFISVIQKNSLRGSPCVWSGWRDSCPANVGRTHVDRIQKNSLRGSSCVWSGWRDSNPRPLLPESSALPTAPQPDD